MFGMLSLSKILGMGRAVSDPSLASGSVLDNETAALMCDKWGVLWTRNIPASSELRKNANSNPGVGLVASATLAAVGAAYNAVLITASYGDTAAASSRTLVLRNGASGVGPIIWQMEVGPIVANDSKQIIVPFTPGFCPYGSFLTPMCLEFTAAPAATGRQSVSLDAYQSK